MAFDQTRSVKPPFSAQLSEKHQRITFQNNEIEVQLRNLLDLRGEFGKKQEECQVLCEKAELLVNQDSSSTISSTKDATKGLREIAGTTAVSKGSPAHQVSLSWDFEGLKGVHGVPEHGHQLEAMDKVIAKLQRELRTNEAEQQVLQGQMENEHCLKNAGRRQDTTAELAGEKRIDDFKFTGTETANKIHELEHVVNLQSQRIEELLETSNEVKKRADEALKQKEELLRVNHQWDEQYRFLKEDKNRIIAEMQTKYQAQATCEAERQGEDVDFTRLNQQKTVQIAELTQANETLSQEVALLREKHEKNDQLWVAAKKMIDEEREMRVAASQQAQVSQERCKQLEIELQNSKKARECLKTEIQRLTAFYCSSSSGSASTHAGSALPANVTEQIEVLKQQIRVYADDFSNERADRERIQAEKELLKEKVKSCEDEIALLKEQVRIYHDDFSSERREKESIQRQLRERRPVPVIQAPQEEPWYMAAPQDYVSMGGANHVQRRQERNYDPPAYTPREIQELAFQQQQQLHARGNNGRHSPGGGLCHGCVADCDVVDGSSGGQQTHQCPRCDRKFSSQQRRAFEEHIDKCTT